MFKAIQECNVLYKCFSIPKWNIVEKHWYRLNHVYGWFVPTTLTIGVYITSKLDGGYDPGFGKKSCWFEGTFLFFYDGKLCRNEFFD